MKFELYFECLCQLWVYIERCWGSSVFVQARVALQDLRKIFSTNDLRLVKSFLEISNESLTLKSSKHENQENELYFKCFVSIIGIY